MSSSAHKYNNFGEFDRKKPPIPSTINSARKGSNQNTNQNYFKKSDSSSISNNSNIKQIGNQQPSGSLGRCNSTGKILLREYKENAKPIDNQSRKNSANKSHTESKDHSTIGQNQSKISTISTVGQYLDRRHFESQEKINKLRVEKFQKEISNFEFRPKISENSKKIISRIANEESVMHLRSKEKETTGSYYSYLTNNQAANLKVNPSSQNVAINNPQKTTLIRNNSSFQSKPKNTINNSNTNLTNKMTKTIEELNDYKKIIEKRENIVPRKEEEKNTNYIQPMNSNVNRKRPSSTNPKQRSENPNTSKLTHNSNTNTITITQNNEEKKSDNKYYQEYDTEKVIDARSKLNNYLIDKKNNNVNVNNNVVSSNVVNNFAYNNSKNVGNNNNNNITGNFNNNDQKKLFYIDNNRKENSSSNNQPIKIKPNEVLPVKNMQNINNINNTTFKPQLPAERAVNLNIDFNQLDQFSPPNNTNNANIIYDIQQAYAKSNNAYGILSSNNNNNNSNNFSFKRENAGTSQNNQYINNPNSNTTNVKPISSHHQRTHSQSNPIKEESMNKPTTGNKRKEDLDFFKNYVENIKVKTNYNTIDPNSNAIQRTNSERKIINYDKDLVKANLNVKPNPISKSNYYPESNPNPNSNNTPVRNNNASQRPEQFKLDPSSKNYALERIQEMKERAKLQVGNTNTNNQFSYRKN